MGPVCRAHGLSRAFQGRPLPRAQQHKFTLRDGDKFWSSSFPIAWLSVSAKMVAFGLDVLAPTSSRDTASARYLGGGGGFGGGGRGGPRQPCDETHTGAGELHSLPERIPPQVPFLGELLHVLGRRPSRARLEEPAPCQQWHDGEHLG